MELRWGKVGGGTNLQGGGARCDAADFGTKQAHAEDVERLSLHIL